MGDLLIVDDELPLTEAYARFFARRGHDVRRAATGAAAIAARGERRPDVMLLDVNLPDRSGFDVFATLPEDGPVVVMISGQAEVPLAVRAMKQGVENFLTKPVDLEHLGVAIDRAFETARLRQLRRYFNDRRTSTGQVALGSSPLMREMTTQVDLLAGTVGTAVLLLGESGTGKGRIAELIHAGSVRATGPFVECSCSGAAVDALDAELFGFEDAAGVSRPGLVELAAGGSLFLDEIADLPLSLQPKVLRVQAGRAVRRAGGGAGNGARRPIAYRHVAGSGDGGKPGTLSGGPLFPAARHAAEIAAAARTIARGPGGVDRASHGRTGSTAAHRAARRGALARGRWWRHL